MVAMEVSRGDTKGVEAAAVIGEDTDEVVATAVSRGDTEGVVATVWRCEVWDDGFQPLSLSTQSQHGLNQSFDSSSFLHLVK